MVTNQSVWSLVIISTIFLVTIEAIGVITREPENSIKSLQEVITAAGNNNKVGRQIFGYKRNGMKLDIRIVPAVNDTSDEDDKFPMPPAKDLGRCVLDLSMICIKDRIARYIDTLTRLDKITLLGSSVKFVKVKEIPRRVFSHRAMDPSGLIDRSIDEFFDRFALRVILPKWNKRKEQNQIDFMFDDNSLVEGKIIKRKLRIIFVYYYNVINYNFSIFRAWKGWWWW